MKILRKYIKSYLNEICRREEYWGVGGAGMILVCEEDGTVFLQKRSAHVTGGAGQWAFPGGGVHPMDADWEMHYETPIPEEYVLPDDSPRFEEMAKQEFLEEVGMLPPHVIIDSYIYEDCGFKYKTFIANVTLQAKKASDDSSTNWESDANDWFSQEEFNSKDLFFGFTPELISKVNKVIS